MARTARAKNPPPTRGNAALGQIEFILSNLWARWWTSGPGPPKSGRLDQDFSLWARKNWSPDQISSRPGPNLVLVHPAGTDEPDLLLGQIACSWSRSKIDPEQRNPTRTRENPTRTRENPTWARENPTQTRENPTWAKVQNSSGTDDPVHSGPDF